MVSEIIPEGSPAGMTGKDMTKFDDILEGKVVSMFYADIGGSPAADPTSDLLFEVYYRRLGAVVPPP